MARPQMRMGLSPLFVHRGAVLLALFLMLWLVWRVPPVGSFHARLQGLIYDAMLPVVPLHADPRVVVIDIDEPSLDRVGRWPWPRDRVADLIDGLRAAGAAVIGIDVLFPEASDKEADRRLADTLAQDDVVAAVAFGLMEWGGANTVRDQVFFKGEVMDPRFWPNAELMVGLAPALMEEATAGHITPHYDPDNVIRRLYPVICSTDCYPMLVLRMLQSWSGGVLALDTSVRGREKRACVAGFCLSLNADGTVSIPYHHPSDIRLISAEKVLSGTPLPELRGALVLVGTSAVGLGDRVATPLSATTPGVMIHATLLAAALDSFRWVQLPLASWWLSFLIVTVALLLWWWPGAGRYLRVATWVWLLGLLIFSLLMPRFGYWLHPLPLWTMLLIVVLLASIWQASTLMRQRRQMYRAFTAYVPHEVIKTLIRHNLRPEQLDAQRLEVTVLFADIRGFTPLSEHLEPEQLVDLTSQLFTAISEEVHNHKGTLDKFMGDAVMAFWGAPLRLKDHAELALSCASAIQRRLYGMADKLAQQGYPEIVMTIGLESGPVAVGNFGSRQRRAYTVMGKTVNLAAHLQPMCARFDVSILCGPGLCRQLPDRIQSLGQIEIRGIDGLQEVGTPSDESN